jgi:hypothetical protein
MLADDEGFLFETSFHYQKKWERLPFNVKSAFVLPQKTVYNSFNAAQKPNNHFKSNVSKSLESFRSKSKKNF